MNTKIIARVNGVKYWSDCLYDKGGCRRRKRS